MGEAEAQELAEEAEDLKWKGIKAKGSVKVGKWKVSGGIDTRRKALLEEALAAEEAEAQELAEEAEDLKWKGLKVKGSVKIGKVRVSGGIDTRRKVLATE